MAISSPKHEKKPRKKKPRFPGLSCERGTGLEPATLSLGNAASAAWINGFAHNHAENDPPGSARIRSGQVVTGAQLAHTNEHAE